MNSKCFNHHASLSFFRLVSLSWQGSAAITFAAFLLCSTLSRGAVQATTTVSDKARNRAERALREGEFQTAEQLYRELLAKNEHDEVARLGLSYALLKQRKLQESFDNAACVVAANPLSARAHALLGSVLLTAGDFRLATEEFRTALSIKDTESLAVAGLALIDFYENRFTASLNGLRRAAFLNPNEPDHFFSLAQAAARTENYKEAADAYERFLAIAPRTDADRRARIRGLIDFLRYLGNQSALYVPSGASRVTVPFVAKDNRPMITVHINGGKEALSFVLDTGSGISVISQETAQRLGLRAVARGGMARAVGGGGRFEIVYGFLSSIEIGEARIENVPVYIRKFFDIDGRKPVDGYIGLSVINKFLATLDYRAQTLTINRGRVDADDLTTVSDASAVSSATGAASTNVSEIPLRTTSSGFLSGEVQLEGLNKPLNFIIDTGASISVISEQLAAQEELSRFKRDSQMRVYGAAGIAENVKMILLPRVAFGAMAREKVDAVVLDLDPINETTGFSQTGIIGGNFLRHFRVTFDFQRNVMRFESLTGAKDAEPHPASARK
jgi:predicted aspartyl protease/Tfp pilus assembly protein PilF